VEGNRGTALEFCSVVVIIIVVVVVAAVFFVRQYVIPYQVA
jgi:uncharacterized protein YpmB